MYLFFDTETNGFPPKCRMTQLAYQLFDGDGILIEEFQSLIKPDGWKIPKEKFFIENGMSTERCEEYGIPVNVALSRFHGALEASKYKIAHNINFDNQILTNELITTGFDIKRYNEVEKYCTMLTNTEFVGALNKWGKPGKWPTLMELHVKLFGCEFEGAHDALDDVKAMSKSFFELKRRGIITI